MTEVSKPQSSPEAMRSYAERSLGLRHGEKTEDELLQRIWNLSGDVTRLVEQLMVTRRERDLALDLLEPAPWLRTPSTKREDVLEGNDRGQGAA